LVAILFSPLILTISRLVLEFKENSNFLQFGNVISPFFGFMAILLYFFGKLGSCALTIHIFSSFLQSSFQFFSSYNILSIDILFIILLTLFNIFNIKVNRYIQYFFLISKFIPIIFVILSGLFIFNFNSISLDKLYFSNIPFSIPLVIYAFSGFEAVCSLSQSISNPSKNGSLAIFTSFILVVLISFLYQFFIFLSLFQYLFDLKYTYLNIFFSFFHLLGLDSYNFLSNILNLLIAISALGSFYGILYSNSWNLYNIAKKGLFIFNDRISKLNSFAAPVYSLIIEAIFIILYILISKADYISLQQVSAFGSISAYTISSFALLKLSRRYLNLKYLAYASLFSSSLLLQMFLYTLLKNGLSYIFIFYITFISILSLIFYINHKPNYQGFENI
jgi:amino acid transporter